MQSKQSESFANNFGMIEKIGKHLTNWKCQTMNHHSKTSLSLCILGVFLVSSLSTMDGWLSPSLRSPCSSFTFESSLIFYLMLGQDKGILLNMLAALPVTFAFFLWSLFLSFLPSFRWNQMMEWDAPLGLDVLEHAYYKKYSPGRITHISNWVRIIVFLLLSIFSFFFFWSATSDGIQFHGKTHTSWMIVFNATAILFLSFLPFWNARRSEFRYGAVFDFLLFVWLGWCAFPYLKSSWK